MDEPWIQELCTVLIIFNLKLPKYHYDLILPITSSDANRNKKNIPFFKCRTDYFLNSYVRNEWEKLDIKITNIIAHNNLKNYLLHYLLIIY